ncbi:MAG: MarR family transcriptional regulator [Candidatus Bathyarchaeota archaeon]|jgi:DNA-binding MarR family transcriptional regulator
MTHQREGGFLISKIHYIGQRIFNQLLRRDQLDVNTGQGRILYVLWHKDEIPINELAKRTALKTSTLTTMLDRLEARGHLKRVSSREDRRVTLIKLTEKNKALHEEYRRISLEMIELFYKDFSTKEITTFESFLTRILKNLTNHTCSD